MGRYVRWLIERGQDVGHDPVLWWADSPVRHPESSTGCWTNIAALAKMFETRESAQRYADVYAGPLCVVTEHIFLDAEVSPVEEELATLRERLAKKLWECPDCMFTFDAGHSNQDGTYSCPECEVGKLRAKLAAAERANEILKQDALNLTEKVIPNIEQRALAAEALAEQNAKDAERYRFLRDDDNWCDDGPLTWEALGECSGTDFDAFVQAKMTEAYYADPANQKQEPIAARKP